MPSDYEILASIEWVFDWESGEDLCPYCEFPKREGHKVGCDFAWLLTRMGGRKTGYDGGALSKSKDELLSALRANNFNKTRTAKAMGIPLRSFHRYVSLHGLRTKDFLSA